MATKTTKRVPFWFASVLFSIMGQGMTRSECVAYLVEYSQGMSERDVRATINECLKIWRNS